MPHLEGRRDSRWEAAHGSRSQRRFSIEEMRFQLSLLESGRRDRKEEGHAGKGRSERRRVCVRATVQVARGSKGSKSRLEVAVVPHGGWATSEPRTQSVRGRRGRRERLRELVRAPERERLSRFCIGAWSRGKEDEEELIIFQRLNPQS